MTKPIRRNRSFFTTPPKESQKVQQRHYGAFVKGKEKLNESTDDAAKEALPKTPSNESQEPLVLKGSAKPLEKSSPSLRAILSAVKSFFVSIGSKIAHRLQPNLEDLAVKNPLKAVKVLEKLLSENKRDEANACIALLMDQLDAPQAFELVKQAVERETKNRSYSETLSFLRGDSIPIKLAKAFQNKQLQPLETDIANLLALTPQEDTLSEKEDPFPEALQSILSSFTELTTQFPPELKELHKLLRNVVDEKAQAGKLPPNGDLHAQNFFMLRFGAPLFFTSPFEGQQKANAFEISKMLQRHCNRFMAGKLDHEQTKQQLKTITQNIAPNL